MKIKHTDTLGIALKQRARAFKMKEICRRVNLNYERYRNWSIGRLGLTEEEIKALNEAMDEA